MLLFHASPTGGIDFLEPRLSSHGRPLVYFSDRWENVLVYLSNAVEKYCREAGLPARKSYRKWGSYGFSPEGLLHLDEYWPNATEETYRGAAGYIYTVEGTGDFSPLPDIPHAFLSEKPVKTVSCEFVPDAYEALRQAQAEGKIILKPYGENSAEMLQWIENAARQEYAQTEEFPYYRAFLKAKFSFLK